MAWSRPDWVCPTSSVALELSPSLSFNVRRDTRRPDDAARGVGAALSLAPAGQMSEWLSPARCQGLCESLAAPGPWDQHRTVSATTIHDETDL